MGESTLSDSIASELDYSLKRLREGDRQPWVYVATGEFAARLGQWPLARECLDRLDPFDAPSQELRRRLKALQPQVSLPRLPRNLNAPAGELVTRMFIEEILPGSVLRSANYPYLGASVLVGVISFFALPSYLVAMGICLLVATAWMLRGPQIDADLRKVHDLSLNQRLMFHGGALGALLIPYGALLINEPALAVLCIPVGTMLSAHLLAYIRGGPIYKDTLSACAIAAMLASAMGMLMAFLVSTASIASVLALVVGLQLITFLNRSMARVGVRALARSRAEARAAEDLQVGITEAFLATRTDQASETTRKSIPIPTL